MSTRSHTPASRAARSLALGVLLAAAGARASGPRASEREAARALADEGANAFAQGDYARAHEELLRAFRLVPAPTIALLDARALARLGRLVEARDAYLRALAAPVDGDSPAAFRDAAAHARSELDALERRLPRLTVRVRDAPRDARVRVWIDARELAASELGAARALDPAPHWVRLEVDGAPAAALRVELREGERRVVDLEPPSSGDGLSRALAVTSFGLGAAGLLTGIVAGGVALDARKDADTGCPARRCEAGSAGAAALEDFRTYRAISTVGYAVGVAGPAVGTILLVTSSKEQSPEVGIAPSLTGVRLRGKF